MASSNQRVRKAVLATEKLLGDYWENTCKLRSGNGGSCYPGKTPQEIADMVMEADWHEAQHPDVMPGCSAFKASIPGGLFGLVKVDDLPDSAVLIAVDPKGTGRISMTVCKEYLASENMTDETWLIVGPEAGVDVVYTFHPGEPVRPSLVETAELADGTRLTKGDAKAFGFDLAKIVF